MQRKITRLLTVLVAAALCWGAYEARRTNGVIHNANAVWWVADMVVEYMKSHGDKWPSNWDDLREPYGTCAARLDAPSSFDDCRSRVEVDWDANPHDLRIRATADGKPQFRVIRLRDGTDSHWENKDPNQIVYDYLLNHMVLTPDS